MNCQYCSASNAAGEHRCKRCGRRIDAAESPGTMPRFQHAATAPALDFEVQPERHPSPGQPKAPESRRPVYQPSLFASPRVVSFESFAPESVDVPVPKISKPKQKSRKSLPGQQSFGFDAALDRPGFETVHATYRSGANVIEPVIGCDDPVALPAHRTIAAAFDASLVTIAVALFFSVFRLGGGQVILNKHTVPLVIAITAVFFLLYKCLWCFADGDTAGMRWAHLRLVNFDGQPPSRDQRLCRMASGWLSLLAAGLGLLWALVDEESLTWHDHISKTFPTPY